MSKSDFLERNQQPSNMKRTAVIDLFVKKAGDKLSDALVLAEELQDGTGCSFERALADALATYKLA